MKITQQRKNYEIIRVFRELQEQVDSYYTLYKQEIP